MTDTTDQQTGTVAQVEESHRFFIRAARDFYDSGRANFTPNYDNYGDLLASAEAMASLASVSSASAIKASAEMALMYLQTGFIECPQCGEEVPTKVLDAAYELATVVQAAPCAAPPEPVPATNQAGEVERNLEAQRQTIEACACLVDRHPMRMDYNARMTLADAIRCLTPDESLAGDTLDAKTADYNGHKPNRYLPEIPPGASLFAVNPSTGAWHYVNHAGTWQGMPNPLATQPATPQEGEERAAIVSYIRRQSDRGADIGNEKPKGSTARAAFGGGSLALKRVADNIEVGEHVINDNAATPTPPTLSEDLREAAQAVVDDYPVAAGMYPSLEGTDGKPGYGSIRRLAAALAQVKAS